MLGYNFNKHFLRNNMQFISRKHLKQQVKRVLSKRTAFWNMENEKKIKVVLLEPGKLARAAEIDASLAGMQKVVGGLIEPFYPFEEQVCMICKGHCEIDKFADRSYRAIHDVKEDEWYGEDITKTESADLPRGNLWAGGFPCQDISVSGRQRGLAGKRSSLFFEIVRLLKGTPAEDRPEWLVLENVKNLLSVNRGWDFATVLHSLAEIGYHIEYGLLNSRFHGVPQNRERIYLVAYRHFRAEGGRKIFPVTAGDGKALIQLIGGTQGKRVYDPAGVSCTLMSEGGGFAGRTGMYFIDLCKGEPRLTEHARCIKARYDSGITNHSGDKSGVLCMSGECPDRTEETALIQLKRGDPKILEQDHTKCLIAGYDKIGVSNRGESSGIFYGCRAVLTPDRENKRQNGRRFKALSTVPCGAKSALLTVW